MVVAHGHFAWLKIRYRSEGPVAILNLFLFNLLKRLFLATSLLQAIIHFVSIFARKYPHIYILKNEIGYTLIIKPDSCTCHFLLHNASAFQYLFSIKMISYKSYKYLFDKVALLNFPALFLLLNEMMSAFY